MTNGSLPRDKSREKKAITDANLTEVCAAIDGSASSEMSSPRTKIKTTLLVTVRMSPVTLIFPYPFGKGYLCNAINFKRIYIDCFIHSTMPF